MRLDERGKQCPLPVVETRKALEAAGPGETIEVVVDNEIAVQNLRKMADHKGLEFRSEKTGEREFTAWVRAAEGGTAAAALAGQGTGEPGAAAAQASGRSDGCPAPACCPPAADGGIVAVISSNCMGQGDDTLGKLLMKGFIYALSQQEQLPRTVLLYNGGAFLSCEGSDSVEDLRELEAQGVEILTCGTCLNHYGLEGKLQVGGVTNMYEIAERMTGARLLVRP
ncbi:sulfurtransferase-like selenium metabolism protein YedF [Enterocloster lavalensis]|uniref:sulfurtransferase-like selenium metabolism protein YedF n=1 Tax=Enterocloster lavalensis TaxID=460384 RepID=UPI001D08E470|nr:sulfurtransferase-like selenium metabolism protein YedF [Enterocloster lavalensis]MCB6344389.1 sulfurtransferase-like selenium metabolism protein YedF [Enterocloster lavalensis]